MGIYSVDDARTAPGGLISLPLDRQLSVGALAGLFDQRASSYKYLFFLALLDEVPGLFHRGDNTLSLRQLIINLLQFGWYPHRFFRLNFGRTDQVGRVLDKLQFTVDERAITHRDTTEDLRAAIEAQFEDIGAQRFQRFVPYRLLSSFFKEELRGLPDHQKNKRIVALARQSFQTEHPALYHFTTDEQAVVLQPDWVQYLFQNHAIVRGWALLQWARYLQAVNPNVPAILNKIAPPLQRGNLQSQRRYWRRILSRQPLHCIYSGHLLDPQHFNLDHFLPWSFICHDELWNLIPADPVANRSKGRNLPAEQLLDHFVEQQYEGLHIYRQLYDDENSWKKMAQSFIDGLSVSEQALLDRKQLLLAYESKMTPLMALAKNMGY